MYQKVLCAIDVSSEESEMILAKAAAQAEKYGASLSIAHIIEYSLLPRDYQKQLEQETWPKLNELADKYQVDEKKRHVLFGQTYTRICELEQKNNIDLIVVGSHGKHGLKALLGSTANGVLQLSSCDVLLVKV